MITEDYVSFEVAKLLKEKGFDVPEYRLHAVYRDDGALQSITADRIKERTFIQAPTNQMALKWLREEHNIILNVAPNVDGDYECTGSFCCLIYKENKLVSTLADEEYSYEEAAEAGLKYCLTKLI